MEQSSNGSQPELTAGQKALRAYRLHMQGMSMERAVRIAGGTTVRQLEAVKGVLSREPSFEEAIAAGELTLNAAQVAAGYRQHKPVAGKNFGRGDKWIEVANVLMQYLAGWRTRGYKFTHVPPAEAEKRVKVIDEMIAELQNVRADLVNRSVRATSAAPRG